jgi:hypothetical protein
MLLFVKPVQDYITVVNLKQDLTQKPVNFFQDETDVVITAYKILTLKGRYTPARGEEAKLRALGHDPKR